MTITGLIWAAFAPLLLVLIVWLVRWGLRKAGVGHAMPLAILFVATPVASVWFWDRAEFVSVCEGEGKPMIYRKASADGIFLNSGTANSFGMRYLHDEGFLLVEAPSIYKRGGWVRYQRGSDKKTINSIDIPAITARYQVWEDFSQPFSHTGLSQKKIIDRTTGEALTKADSATFSGGRMKWVLGAWGVLSCPGTMISPQDFQDYYHLARNTLR